MSIIVMTVREQWLTSPSVEGRLHRRCLGLAAGQDDWNPNGAPVWKKYDVLQITKIVCVSLNAKQNNYGTIKTVINCGDIAHFGWHVCRK